MLFVALSALIVLYWHCTGINIGNALADGSIMITNDPAQDFQASIIPDV